MGAPQAVAGVGFLSKEQVDESLAEVVRMVREGMMTPRQYHAAVVRLAWAYARAEHLHEAMACLTTVPGEYLTRHMPGDAEMAPGLAEAAVSLASYLVRRGFVEADAVTPPEMLVRWPGKA